MRDHIIDDFHMGTVALVPQDFRTMNRGDMFVPSVSVNAEIVLAMAATPTMGRPMNVHAIPITYARPNADMRIHGPIGMATPDYKG